MSDGTDGTPLDTEGTGHEPGSEAASTAPPVPAAVPQPGPRPVPHPVPRPAPRPAPGPAAAAAAPTAADPSEEALREAAGWGRIAEDGTVLVRIADGERAVGTWLAGTHDEGLIHYARRYADLAAEVAILEHRVASDGKSAASGARKLLETLPTAAVVGDVAALQSRLDAIVAAAGQARQAAAAAKASRSAGILARKTALVDEAAKLAESSEWKAAGDRFRSIVDDWKAAGVGDRGAEQQLWQRLAAARDQFTQRRSAHFAELDEQRRGAQQRKERMVAEAEELATSTDFVSAGNRLKQLQSQWKTVGRAPREVEELLWQRLRAAADAFFARRNAELAERDEQFRANQVVKEAIAAEAEALAASLQGARDLTGPTRRLRELQERWEAAGKVPREAMGALEGRMQAVETRFRAASEARWSAPSVEASPLVIRLRESVAKLENRQAKALAAGRTKDAEEAAATLETQRAWLAQAEGSQSVG
ncbi:MAG TPA: DUF349 domain-containing protein [Frankiaceae bacterium]